MSRRVEENSTKQDHDGPAGASSVPTQREREALSTFANLISTISDFFNTAIHQILYERDIYPKEMFQDRNKYKLAVKQSMYYRVNKWVTDAVKACSEELLQVGGILLVFYSGPETSPQRVQPSSCTHETHC